MQDHFKNDFVLNRSENNGTNKQWSENDINQALTKQEQIISKQLHCIKSAKERLTKWIQSPPALKMILYEVRSLNQRLEFWN